MPCGHLSTNPCQGPSPLSLKCDHWSRKRKEMGKESKRERSGALAERLRHCSREQRAPNSSPAWTSVLR